MELGHSLTRKMYRQKTPFTGVGYLVSSFCAPRLDPWSLFVDSVSIRPLWNGLLENALTPTLGMTTITLAHGMRDYVNLGPRGKS